MEGFLGGLLGVMVGPWLILPAAILVVCVLAIVIHVLHSAGSVVERRVTRALDERDARR